MNRLSAAVAASLFGPESRSACRYGVCLSKATNEQLYQELLLRIEFIGQKFAELEESAKILREDTEKLVKKDPA